MTDEHRALERELFDHPADVFGVVTDMVGAVRRPVAVAVSAKVERQRTKPRSEVGNDEVPPARVRRPAVQQHDREAISAVIDDVQPKSSAREVTVVQGTKLPQ